MINNSRNTRIIHFLTYSDNNFFIARQRLVNEAKLFNEFTTINSLGPENLNDEFKNTYKNILNQPRGAGYWIWRSLIIQNLLDKIKENEYILYLDAGCKLNSEGKRRFFEYLNILDNSNYGILSFAMSGNYGPGTFCRERDWTVREIFQYFNIEKDSKIAKSAQLLGGVFIIKKNNHSKYFINLMLQAIKNNPEMFTDKYNDNNQEHYFNDNRHDQSVSSILRKIIGTALINCDETWMPPWSGDFALQFPFWAPRLRN
jgi:hypothetical protein